MVIINTWFKLEKLEQIVATLKAKNQTGIAIDFGCWDDVNEYGQNVSAWVAQTKEQREVKTPKFYVSNGKVVYVDDKGATAAPRKDESVEGFPLTVEKTVSSDDGMPF